MNSLLRQLREFWKAGEFTDCKDAAEIIRRFAHDKPSHPYEWDDFESVEEKNPEVRLALHLCWHFAGEYPSEKPTEYCGEGATPYFLAIADALDKGLLHSVDHQTIIEALKQGNLPEDVKSLLPV